MKRIGVLAVQGDFAAHARMLERAGATAIEVRRADDLYGAGQPTVAGLILPGGESTTMLNLLTQADLITPIREFARSGKPIFGTCAGAILLAREVVNPYQASFGLMDISIERNAYGRQVDSHIATAATKLAGGPMEAVFIRAPRIVRLGAGVEVIAAVTEEPVFVREGNLFAATFHPELTDDMRAHRLFLDSIGASAGAADSVLPATAHIRG
jgi:pyridoxal 5'-phosphate synthase pdxT subunit